MRQPIRAPETIVLTRYKGVPVTLAPFCRRNLFRRDRHTCQYCGSRPGTPELSIDHIVPRSQGGEHAGERLTTPRVVARDAESLHSCLLRVQSVEGVDKREFVLQA